MGTVHLTSGHHGLYFHGGDTDFPRRVQLHYSLLARPIYNSGGRTKAEISGGTAQVIRAALQGLMDLDGYDAAVSYHVVLEGGVPHIALPHRVWGEITRGSPKNVVVKFSHDSRYQNRPFFTQLEWLEEECPPNVREMEEVEYQQLCDRWPAERWRAFFERRIEDALA